MVWGKADGRSTSSGRGASDQMYGGFVILINNRTSVWSVWHPCSSQFIFKELWSPNNGTRKIILSQYSFILNNYYNKTHQNREANLLICRVLRLIVTNQTMRQWNKFYPLLIKFRIQINTRGLGMVDFCYIELVF